MDILGPESVAAGAGALGTLLTFLARGGGKLLLSLYQRRADERAARAQAALVERQTQLVEAQTEQTGAYVVERAQKTLLQRVDELAATVREQGERIEHLETALQRAEAERDEAQTGRHIALSELQAERELRESAENALDVERGEKLKWLAVAQSVNAEASSLIQDLSSTKSHAAPHTPAFDTAPTLPPPSTLGARRR